MRVVWAFFAAAASFAAAPSFAAEPEREIACAARYSLEEQIILEWAALGGDPHAQMALAACAFPDSRGEMSAEALAYAVKWSTLAVCEAEPSPAHDRRDIRMRKLKENARLSFRRFGGLTEDEDLNWREKDFIEYRKERIAGLMRRHDELMDSLSEAELQSARARIAGDFARMGPLGLLRLAELSSCPAFGAGPEFEAAAWGAAEEAWRAARYSEIYAAADSADYDLAKIAAEKSAALEAESARIAMSEKDRLLRLQPARMAEMETRLARLEEKAALAALSDFTLPSRRADGGLFDAGRAQSSLTTALQFALESLGYVEFNNGPDNDYGPTTEAAVARLKGAAGEDGAPFLANEEARSAICAAAILKNDPVSLYHVALMYQNGWGFPRNEAIAAAALARAEAAMSAALAGADALPDWKAREYRDYARDIRAASRSAGAPVTEESAQAICR